MFIKVNININIELSKNQVNTKIKLNHRGLSNGKQDE
jgi:hypothetical protein